MTNASDYTYCPDCKKKGVTLRLRNHGEDHLGCRYCDWSAFTSEAAPVYAIDTFNLARHKRAQAVKLTGGRNATLTNPQKEGNRNMSPSTKKRFLSPDELQEAAEEVAAIAAEQGIRAVLIGGYAMQQYGSDRLTGDIDFAFEEKPQGFPRGKLLSFGGVQTRTSCGVPLDLIVRNDRFTSLYEEAIEHPLNRKGIPIVKPEYLIAMKLASARPKDDLDFDVLATSGFVNMKKAAAIIAKHLGPYAEQEFEQSAAIAAWHKGRERK